MDSSTLILAQTLARTASEFELQRTDHLPRSVTVALSDEILVVVLNETLTLAEKALAKTEVGLAQVQRFHQELFSSSADPLRLEINRISGRLVSEAAAQVEPSTGSVVHAFTTGTMVQVFLLNSTASAETG